MMLARWMIALAVMSSLCGAVAPAEGAELRTLVQGEKTLNYFLVLPEHFDQSKSYPVLLALPPGNQTQELAQTALDKYWEAEAKVRGWVVIAPIGQYGRTFHDGLERAIPPLLDEVARAVNFEGGRAYLAGVSVGGMSAYRVATEYTPRFFTMLVLPGYPPDDRATLALRNLKDLPHGVHAFVGAADAQWLNLSQVTKQRLDAYGVENTLEIIPGEGHILNMKAIELYDLLDGMRPKAMPVVAAPTTAVPNSASEPTTPAATLPTPASPPAQPVVASPAPPPTPPETASEHIGLIQQEPVAAPAPGSAPAATPPPAAHANELSLIEQRREVDAVNEVLDDFHDAAAKADEARYFGHMDPLFVFLGTDATERWTLEEFRTFAHPYFAKGKAWTYRPNHRSVTVTATGSPDIQVAWFDEMLDNEHLGVTRGSGVLRKIGGVWRLTQYNLSLPVPNDLADEVVAKIKAKAVNTP